jgi:hypothetical protein
MLLSPKQCTSAHRCPVQSLKEAAYCSFHHDEKGQSIEFFADLAGVRPATFRDWINPDQEGHLPFARVASLIPYLTNFALLDHLESLAHRVAFAVPRGQHADERAQASAVREFGEYLVRASTASADGHYTHEEAEQVEREGREAIAAVAAHIELVKLHAQQQSGPRPVSRMA